MTGLKVGDKVAIKPNLSDGTCRRCTMGRNNCCDSLGFIGYSGKWWTGMVFFRRVQVIMAHASQNAGSAGGLSDHVVVDRKHAIRLPESIPLDIGGKTQLVPRYLRILTNLSSRGTSLRCMARCQPQLAPSRRYCANRRRRSHRPRNCASTQSARYQHNHRSRDLRAASTIRTSLWRNSCSEPQGDERRGRNPGHHW